MPSTAPETRRIPTDLMMPIMDGVPIVLMRSLSETMATDNVGSYTAFVRKPFKIFDYIDLTARLISRG